MTTLMKHLEDRIFKSAAPMAIRHLKTPDLQSGDPTVRAILDQAATEFQVAPPLTLHISDPSLLAGMWHAMREAYVVNPATRAQREAVAAAVSTLNTCPYCVTVHEGMFAAAGGTSADAATTDIRAAQEWAAATLSPGSPALHAPGIPPQDIPQLFGTASLFHYTNRMVSVFLTNSPVPIPGMLSAPGKRLAKAGFALMSKRMASVDVKPGQCAISKTDNLPKEFSWARANPHVAGAFAHFAQAAQRAGEQSVPAGIRRIVLENLADWQGEQPPLSRAWVEDAVAAVDDPLKPAARLALLTARAPWQVDDALIAGFRRISAGDKALVQVVGWAAFAATRRIAGWYPATPCPA